MAQTAAQKKAWKEANAEQQREWKAAWYQENKERLQAKARERHAEKRDELNAQCRVRNKARTGTPAERERCRLKQAKRRVENPSIVAAQNLARQTATSQSTPPWLTKAQRKRINDWYRLGRAIGYHVDHIVPLQGKNVCGLHVPWNLQTLSPLDNRIKGNRLLEDVSTW